MSAEVKKKKKGTLISVNLLVNSLFASIVLVSSTPSDAIFLVYFTVVCVANGEIILAFLLICIFFTVLSHLTLIMFLIARTFAVNFLRYCAAKFSSAISTGGKKREIQREDKQG